MINRVPFGRTVLALQLVAALTFLGYTAIKKDIRFPLLSKAPFELEVVLPDAKGLVPGKEPAVGVAGVPAGRVTQVRLDRGRARVTMRLDHDYEGKVFKDATAFVRPTSILQTLLVNIDPGTPARGAMRAGATIPPARTSAFVHIDELTSTLDADTQAQVQVLIRELAGALRGREPQLRGVFAEVGQLTDTARPLARALDDRRVLLRRLTDHLDVVLGTLGERGDQLADAVALGDRTLGVTARRAPQLEQGVRELAPTVAETQRTLVAARRLARPLVPALDRLGPVARNARPAARQAREVVPVLDRFVGTAGKVTHNGARPARLLAKGLAGQSELIQNDQTPALKELIGLVDLLGRNRKGIIQFAQNLSGATSVNRRAGTYGHFGIVNFETSPQAFGFSAADARSVGGRPSKLARTLGQALELTCREKNTAACLIRFLTPGLPATPLLKTGKGTG